MAPHKVPQNYTFESLHKCCKQFNDHSSKVNVLFSAKMIKSANCSTSDPHPWVEPNDPHSHLTDEPILQNSLDL